MTDLRFTKVASGWYATEDGTKAVIRDRTGYVTIHEREGGDSGHGVQTGLDDDGWSATVDPLGRLREDEGAGDNLNWFDTKREAIDWLSR